MIESKSLRQDKDNHRFSAASAKGEVKLNVESEEFGCSPKSQPHPLRLHQIPAKNRVNPKAKTKIRTHALAQHISAMYLSSLSYRYIGKKGC